MITAKDIMHAGAPLLSFETTVEQAIEYLRSSSLGFAAVNADSKRIQGVLTESHLMRIYLRFQAQPSKDLLILYREHFEPVQLIHEKEIFSEIMKKVLSAVGNRVFVIDDDSKLTGFITAKDLLPFLAISKSSDPIKSSVPDEQTRSDLYLYESFFEKSPFMMHSVNENKKIQMANEILHSVLGYEYGELIGKTIFDLYSKESHQMAETGLQKVLDHGFHKVVHSKMVHKSGKLIDVELVSKSLRDQFQKPIGTMTVSRPMDMNYLIKCLPHI
jgi:PAS domain S-box-containing protein